MNTSIRFDVMRGDHYPVRFLQRVTREQADTTALLYGYRIDWNTIRMIGITTAEVNMVRD